MRPGLVLATLGLVLTATRAGAQDVGARLDSVMRVAAANGFSGAVRVERGGITLLDRGYGLANRATGAPFAPATVVQIGSNTKDFTAVAVLQLRDRGRLSLDDSLARFFPSAPADKRAITVRQLLNHRAGFPLGIGGDFEPVGRQALVDSAMRTRLLFEPGSRESYSNTGYSLLAAIIEQTTRKTYDEHVRDAVLTPLGLQRTGFLLPGFGATDLAHGYLASGADNGTMLARPHAPDGPYWNLRGNGGMLSTTADMLAFYRALFDGERLLTRAARGPMFRADEPVGLAGSDGVNVFLYERDPRSRIEMVIASTNAAARAPAVRAELAKVLGLPAADGGGMEVARRPGGRPASAAVAALVTDLVRAIDGGDAAVLRRFVVEHFAAEPGAPSVDERVERLLGMRERLGAMRVVRVETFTEGPVDVSLDTAVEGPALLRVTLTGVSPARIRALQIQVGG